ncbi:hypothetical protein ACFTQ7_12735 [Lysinibacillus sp. NPDC056959]|uniref:hypothetical protein n=1 Tax=Lysinibacillus sp. NPDC056959 TaxID=3345981 RepID=UPI00362FAAED
MPKIIRKPANVYLDLNDLYESYSQAATIFFDGEPYERKGIISSRDATIHVYRCEKELHTLNIHMHNGLPYWVEGVYEVLKVQAE